jgi:hypothetical protein
MYMSADDEQPLLRKSYLIVLALAGVVMVALNPGIFRKILPQSKSPKARQSSGMSSGGSSPPQVLTESEVAELALIKQDVAAFNRWFTDDERAPLPMIRIVRAENIVVKRLDPNPTKSRMLRYALLRHCPSGNSLSAGAVRDRLALRMDPGIQASIEGVEPEVGTTNFTISVSVDGVGRVGLEMDALSAVYYDVRVPKVWPIRIAGVAESDSGWIALCGGSAKKVGDLIEPKGQNCGYQVLSVSHRCVWLMAYGDANNMPKMPGEAKWGDLDGIVRSADGRPEAVDLGRGRALKSGDSIVSGTGARLTVDDLWVNAVHFRFLPSGHQHSVIDLVCVLMQ